jgi:cysteine desulfurase family protein (TIGR01976 family)
MLRFSPDTRRVPNVRDLEWRRSQFAALSDDVAYLDGPGGSQVPNQVVEAVSGALRTSMSNTGWGYPASERSERTVDQARAAVADLLGAEPQAVAFGGSMTALTYRVASALSRTWEPGDEVVVTELDHDANVRPWVQVAGARQATVRWARVEPTRCVIPTQEFENLINQRTKLVAVTAASNAVGTRPDLMAISRMAHEVGALVYVDAVHAVPHTPVALASTGADIIACSAYKFFGPHIGCLASRAEILEAIEPTILAPAANRVPERFELGTLPFEQLAGVTAAVDFLAGMCESELPRRDQLAVVMQEVDEYCSALFEHLRTGLEAVPSVTVLGPEGKSRTPTLSFIVKDHNPREVALHLSDLGLNVSNGSFYAYELMRRLGLYDHGGAVRVGLLHYNSAAEVDQLIAGVEAFLAFASRS